MNLIKMYPRAIAGIACVVILLAVSSLFRSEKMPDTVQQDISTYFRDLTEQAELLVSSLEQGDEIVVLDLNRDQLGLSKDYAQVIRSMEKQGVSVRHVEKLKRDTEQGWSDFQSGFPYVEFIRVAKEYPDVDAVISLCGPPYFTASSGRGNPVDSPKLLATTLQLNAPSAQKLLKRGWLYAATIPRTEQQGAKVVLVYELFQQKK